MEIPWIHNRVAAHYLTHQVEVVLRADQIARHLDHHVRAWWNQWWTMLRRHDWPGALAHARQLRFQLQAITGQDLRALLHWTYQRTRRSFTRLLPLAWMQSMALVRKPLLEAEELPGAIAMSHDFLQKLLRIRDILAPLRDGLLTPAQARDYFSRILFPGPSEAVIQRILHQGLQGQTWYQAMDTAIRQAQFGPENLVQTIAGLYNQGQDTPAIARAILPLVDGVRSRARRVARTYSVMVAGTTQMEATKPLDDLTIGWQVLATLDENTRPFHRHRNGTIYYKNPKGGQPGLDQMPHPPLESDGSMAWNCFLPGQYVQGNILKVLKARYAGQAFEIRTSSGVVLFVTGNHPIFTKNGFAFARQIKKGDYLWCHHVDQKAFGDTHKEQNPTLIENVSVARNSLMGVKCPTRFDFYGDGEFIQGKIGIVGTNCGMRLERDRQIFQQRSKFRFEFSDNARVRCGDLSFSLRLRHFHNTCMRWSYLPFSLRLGHFGPFNRFSFTLSARSNPHFQKTLADNSPGGSKIFSTGILRHEFLDIDHSQFIKIQRNNALEAQGFQGARYWFAANSEVLAAFSRAPTFVDVQSLENLKIHVNSFHDRVTFIRKFEYDGPVYDVETDTGIFLLNSNKKTMAINKQCRCTLLPVLSPPEYIANDPAKMALFQDAAGNLAPDPATISDWFDQADEKRRRLAMGSRRYSYLRDQEGEHLQYAHFVNPDTGDLMPLPVLQAESATERMQRAARTQQLIAQRRADLESMRQYGFLAGT